MFKILKNELKKQILRNTFGPLKTPDIEQQIIKQIYMNLPIFRLFLKR